LAFNDLTGGRKNLKADQETWNPSWGLTSSDSPPRVEILKVKMEKDSWGPYWECNEVSRKYEAKNK
jgi:hypothetical protein